MDKKTVMITEIKWHQNEVMRLPLREGEWVSSGEKTGSIKRTVSL